VIFVSNGRLKNAKQIRKKLGTFLRKSFYFLLLTPLVLGSYVLSDSIQAEPTVLTVIVTASSFIVAIITGFLINSYYSIKQLRWEKLNRFADLQNQLKDYTESFYWFTHTITQSYNLDWKFPVPIEKLIRDDEWWCKDDSVAVLFIRYLRDFAGNPYDIPDFEIKHAIIREDRLDQMQNYMYGAAGLLTRYKHFKHILKSFNLPDTNDLDKVVITNDPCAEFAAKRLKKEGNPRTLGFWQALIEECTELLDRMKANGKFIYSFNVLEIKQLGLNLLFLSAFGILLPISVLIASDLLPPSCQSFLTIASAAGFMLYFVLGVSSIFSKLSSQRLSYS